MKWMYIFCVFSVAFTSGCAVFKNWGYDLSEIPTHQPTPNLSQEMLINKLLFPDNDCQLPCFGDLYPGISTTKAVEEFVNQFNEDGSTANIRPHETGGVSLSMFFEPAGLFSIELLVENEQFTYIRVGVSSVHEWLSETPYDLPDVFRTYGEPDDVYVVVSGPPTGFWLVIPYNARGFMLRYYATYDSQILSGDEPLSICLHPEVVDLHQIDIWLQNEDAIPLVENNLPDLRAERQIRPWWTIQRMANVTVAEFVDFFVSNPQGCFLLPSLTELRDQGYIP